MFHKHDKTNFMYFFSCVESNMLRERLLMSSLMSAQVTPLGKTLSAHLARVRFLPGVNALVDLQVADAVEALAAERADVPFLLDAATRYGFVQLRLT